MPTPHDHFRTLSCRLDPWHKILGASLCKGQFGNNIAPSVFRLKPTSAVLDRLTRTKRGGTVGL
jgi:hypothetical protein